MTESATVPNRPQTIISDDDGLASLQNGDGARPLIHIECRPDRVRHISGGHHRCATSELSVHRFSGRQFAMPGPSVRHVRAVTRRSALPAPGRVTIKIDKDRKFVP